jgi:hypothetical protein
MRDAAVGELDPGPGYSSTARLLRPAAFVLRWAAGCAGYRLNTQQRQHLGDMVKHRTGCRASVVRHHACPKPPNAAAQGRAPLAARPLRRLVGPLIPTAGVKAADTRTVVCRRTVRWR